MALDPQTQAAIALHRFGFGPRAEAIGKLASDPRGAWRADLDRPGAGAIDDPNLLTSAEAAQAGRDFRQVRKAARLAERIEHDANQQSAQPAQPARNNNRNPGADMSSGREADMKTGADMKSGTPRDPGPAIPQQILLEEAKVRLTAAAAAD